MKIEIVYRQLTKHLSVCIMHCAGAYGVMDGNKLSELERCVSYFQSFERKNTILYVSMNKLTVLRLMLMNLRYNYRAKKKTKQ